MEEQVKKIEMKKIKIGKVGHFDVEIPIIKIGKNNPKVTIVTGIHGDEYTGLIIIKKLIEKIKINNGTIQFILCANPIARSGKTRVASTDLLDLNRIFPGKTDGSITERIAHALTGVLADSDLVIDLHTFEKNSKTTPIIVSCGNKEVDDKVKDLLNALNCEKVWKIEITKEEKYGQALGSFLAKQMVPHFAIETQNINYIKEAELEHIVNGLESVLSKFGVADGVITNIKPKYFRREEIRSHHSGIFIPCIDVEGEIEEGNLVGEILDMHDFITKEVRSTKKGFISDIRRKEFVTEGDTIFSIGEVIENDK